MESKLSKKDKEEKEKKPVAHVDFLLFVEDSLRHTTAWKRFAPFIFSVDTDTKETTDVRSLVATVSRDGRLAQNFFQVDWRDACAWAAKYFNDATLLALVAEERLTLETDGTIIAYCVKARLNAFAAEREKTRNELIERLMEEDEMSVAEATKIADHGEDELEEDEEPWRPQAFVALKGGFPATLEHFLLMSRLDYPLNAIFNVNSLGRFGKPKEELVIPDPKGGKATKKGGVPVDGRQGKKGKGEEVPPPPTESLLLQLRKYDCLGKSGMCISTNTSQSNGSGRNNSSCSDRGSPRTISAPSQPYTLSLYPSEADPTKEVVRWCYDVKVVEMINSDTHQLSYEVAESEIGVARRLTQLVVDLEKELFLWRRWVNKATIRRVSKFRAFGTVWPQELSFYKANNEDPTLARGAWQMNMSSDPSLLPFPHNLILAQLREKENVPIPRAVTPVKKEKKEKSGNNKQDKATEEVPVQQKHELTTGILLSKQQTCANVIFPHTVSQLPVHAPLYRILMNQISPSLPVTATCEILFHCVLEQVQHTCNKKNTGRYGAASGALIPRLPLSSSIARVGDTASEGHPGRTPSSLSAHQLRGVAGDIRDYCDLILSQLEGIQTQYTKVERVPKMASSLLSSSDANKTSLAADDGDFLLQPASSADTRCGSMDEAAVLSITVRDILKRVRNIMCRYLFKSMKSLSDVHISTVPNQGGDGGRGADLTLGSVLEHALTQCLKMNKSKAPIISASIPSQVEEILSSRTHGHIMSSTLFCLRLAEMLTRFPTADVYRIITATHDNEPSRVAGVMINQEIPPTGERKRFRRHWCAFQGCVPFPRWLEMRKYLAKENLHFHPPLPDSDADDDIQEETEDEIDDEVTVGYDEDGEPIVERRPKPIPVFPPQYVRLDDSKFSEAKRLASMQLCEKYYECDEKAVIREEPDRDEFLLAENYTANAAYQDEIIMFPVEDADATITATVTAGNTKTVNCTAQLADGTVTCGFRGVFADGYGAFIPSPNQMRTQYPDGAHVTSGTRGSLVIDDGMCNAVFHAEVVVPSSPLLHGRPAPAPSPSLVCTYRGMTMSFETPGTRFHNRHSGASLVRCVQVQQTPRSCPVYLFDPSTEKIQRRSLPVISTAVMMNGTVTLFLGPENTDSGPSTVRNTTRLNLFPNGNTAVWHKGHWLITRSDGHRTLKFPSGAVLSTKTTAISSAGAELYDAVVTESIDTSTHSEMCYRDDGVMIVRFVATGKILVQHLDGTRMLMQPSQSELSLFDCVRAAAVSCATAVAIHVEVPGLPSIRAHDLTKHGAPTGTQQHALTLSTPEGLTITQIYQSQSLPFSGITSASTVYVDYPTAGGLQAVFDMDAYLMHVHQKSKPSELNASSSCVLGCGLRYVVDFCLGGLRAVTDDEAHSRPKKSSANDKTVANVKHHNEKNSYHVTPWGRTKMRKVCEDTVVLPTTTPGEKQVIDLFMRSEILNPSFAQRLTLCTGLDVCAMGVALHTRQEVPQTPFGWSAAALMFGFGQQHGDGSIQSAAFFAMDKKLSLSPNGKMLNCLHPDRYETRSLRMKKSDYFKNMQLLLPPASLEENEMNAVVSGSSLRFYQNIRMFLPASPAAGNDSEAGWCELVRHRDMQRLVDFLTVTSDPLFSELLVSSVTDRAGYNHGQSTSEIASEEAWDLVLCHSNRVCRYRSFNADGMAALFPLQRQLCITSSTPQNMEALRHDMAQYCQTLVSTLTRAGGIVTDTSIDNDIQYCIAQPVAHHFVRFSSLMQVLPGVTRHQKLAHMSNINASVIRYHAHGDALWSRALERVIEAIPMPLAIQILSRHKVNHEDTISARTGAGTTLKRRVLRQLLKVFQIPRIESSDDGNGVKESSHRDDSGKIKNTCTCTFPNPINDRKKALVDVISSAAIGFWESSISGGDATLQRCARENYRFTADGGYALAQKPTYAAHQLSLLFRGNSSTLKHAATDEQPAKELHKNYDPYARVEPAPQTSKARDVTIDDSQQRGRLGDAASRHNSASPNSCESSAMSVQQNESLPAHWNRMAQDQGAVLKKTTLRPLHPKMRLVTTPSNCIDFGVVLNGFRYSTSILLTNVGDYPCRYRLTLTSPVCMRLPVKFLYTGSIPREGEECDESTSSSDMNGKKSLSKTRVVTDASFSGRDVEQSLANPASIREIALRLMWEKLRGESEQHHECVSKKPSFSIPIPWLSITSPVVQTLAPGVPSTVVLAISHPTPPSYTDLGSIDSSIQSSSMASDRHQRQQQKMFTLHGALLTAACSAHKLDIPVISLVVDDAATVELYQMHCSFCGSGAPASAGVSTPQESQRKIQSSNPDDGSIGQKKNTTAAAIHNHRKKHGVLNQGPVRFLGPAPLAYLPGSVKLASSSAAAPIDSSDDE